MNNEELFAKGLGLVPPWTVSSVNLTNDNGGVRELHIYTDFSRGSEFVNDAGQGRKVYDTEDKVWRHLDFFQHKCYLHCRVPRICMSDGKIRMVDVPWSRKNSGFTLLFEALTMKLIESEMSVSSVSKTVKETATRIWRVFRHWVGKACEDMSLAKVRRIGVDETSSRRGHYRITQFVDLDTRQLIYATTGKGADTFDKFADELKKRGGSPDNIEVVSMDMSPSFISGYFEHFQHAALVFDKFHIVKMPNKAVDDTRKGEAKDKKLLKGHRFTLLRRSSRLSPDKLQEIEELFVSYPELGKAYKFKEGFHDAFACDTAEDSIAYLDQWCSAVKRSSLVFMNKFVNMLWGALEWHHYQLYVSWCQQRHLRGYEPEDTTR